MAWAKIDEGFWTSEELFRLRRACASEIEFRRAAALFQVMLALAMRKGSELGVVGEGFADPDLLCSRAGVERTLFVSLFERIANAGLAKLANRGACIEIVEWATRWSMVSRDALRMAAKRARDQDLRPRLPFGGRNGVRN